jgi:hypothetical protein
MKLCADPRGVLLEEWMNQEHWEASVAWGVSHKQWKLRHRRTHRTLFTLFDNSL